MDAIRAAPKFKKLEVNRKGLIAKREERERERERERAVDHLGTNPGLQLSQAAPFFHQVDMGRSSEKAAAILAS